MNNYIFYPCAIEEMVRYVCTCIIESNSNTADLRKFSTEKLLNMCGNVVFADTTVKLQENGYFGHKVIPQEKIAESEFDKVYCLSFMHREVMYDNLINKFNVPKSKIDKSYLDNIFRAREMFVYNIAQMQRQRRIFGDVAEGGVFRGDFSKVINAAYPNSRLYLFDTFEGFDERDFESDENYNKLICKTGKERYSHLANTSVELVLEKLPHPANVVIKKGYFPQSAQDVDGEFVLVNLDFDLYAPIKAGLEFFYPKMKKGGVIMVHDYYTHYFNANKAVDEFCSEHGLFPVSIGDLFSIAVIIQ